MPIFRSEIPSFDPFIFVFNFHHETTDIHRILSEVRMDVAVGIFCPGVADNIHG